MWQCSSTCLLSNAENLANTKPNQHRLCHFDHLVDFVNAAGKEDKASTVFPVNISQWQTSQPGLWMWKYFQEMDEQLHYSAQAKPRTNGSNYYIPLLIRLRLPFPKFIRKFSPWCKERKFGLWPSALQLEKPISIGWLLFSAYTMDTKTLQQSITDSIQDVPVGLCWKMISLGM